MRAVVAMHPPAATADFPPTAVLAAMPLLDMPTLAFAPVQVSYRVPMLADHLVPRSLLAPSIPVPSIPAVSTAIVPPPSESVPTALEIIASDSLAATVTDIHGDTALSIPIGGGIPALPTIKISKTRLA